jgi:hypothetical protein
MALISNIRVILCQAKGKFDFPCYVMLILGGIFVLKSWVSRQQLCSWLAVPNLEPIIHQTRILARQDFLEFDPFLRLSQAPSQAYGLGSSTSLHSF